MNWHSRAHDIAIEVFSVVLAVLLALMVNEWRTERQNRSDAALALKTVIEELRENHRELKETVGSHSASLDSVNGIVDAIGGGLELQSGGIEYDVALLETTAWEAARMTQAVMHMEYGVVAELSGIYELAGMYQRMTDNFVEDMLRQPRPTSTEEARMMYIHHMAYLSNLASLGDDLSERYDSFLADY